MPNLSGQLARGSLWISASRALVNLLGLLSTIVFARLLMPTDFGLVALGTTMVAILNSVTNLSLSQALMHHPDPTPDHFHSAWTLGALRGLVLGGAFALAGPIAARFYEDPRLASVIYALGLSVFLSGLANPRRIMLQKSLVFWQDFVLNVAQKLIGVIVGIAVAVIYSNYWAIIATILSGQIAQVLISYTVLPFRPKIRFRHATELWSFSVWLTLSQTINTINWRFDQLLIGKVLGRAELGYYMVGDNLSQMPTREASLPLTQTLFPAFTRLGGDRDRLRRAYQRAQALLTFIALPIGIGMALVARPLVLVAMGEKWLPAAVVIEALASIFAIQTIGSLSQPLGMSLGRTRLLFTRDTQIFFVRVPIIIAGMYFGGLHGVILARVITGLVGVGVNLALVKRLIQLSIVDQLKVNLRCVLAVCAMGLAVSGMKLCFVESSDTQLLIFELATLMAVGGLTYGVSTFALWVLAGRPEGPERECLSFAQRVIGKMRTPSDRV